MSGAENRGGRLLLAAAASVALLLPGPGAAGAASPGWAYVPLADPTNPPAYTYWLSDLGGVPTGEAWAVGGMHEDGPGIVADRPLVERWDGCRWSVAPVTGPGRPGRLRAVDAISSRRAWTVGSVEHPGYTGPLVGRYNGTRWSLAPGPLPTGGAGWLDGVDMLSARDGWAVGARYQRNTPAIVPAYRTFATRWTGTRWVEVATPNPGLASSRLHAVSGTSPRDVWAVGTYSDDERTATSKTLILHWDGARWSHVPSPNHGAVNVLAAVHARTANDVWAVGYSHPGDAGGGHPNRWPIVLHWDGAQWTIAWSPLDIGLQFTDVVAKSPTDVWVVGYDGDGHSVFGEQILIARWDGTGFTVNQTPKELSLQTRLGTALNAVTVAGAAVWTVGFSLGDGEDSLPIVLRNQAY